MPGWRARKSPRRGSSHLVAKDGATEIDRLDLPGADSSIAAMVPLRCSNAWLMPGSKRAPYRLIHSRGSQCGE